MAMDVQRDPAILKRKRRNRIIVGAFVGLAVIALTVTVSQLEPAAPTVSGSAIYTGTVKRGPFIREVRGAGVLVPEDIRWITTTATGRVEHIVLRAGAKVTPGTVILELTNPDIRQQVNDAELSWKAAVAQLENAKSNQKTGRLQLEIGLADAQSAYYVANEDLQANKKLFAEGLVAGLQIQVKEANVAREKNRVDLARKQLDILNETEKSQLAPQEATVSQARARYDQLSRQLSDLSVRSTMSGLLLMVAVEEGQNAGPGVNLARVSDPSRLKATIRISETQTRDLAIGQKAKIDTRSGIVSGHVTRIDPASSGGTVGVDVSFDEALPTGARPDQSVDGVIELERADNVLQVESPTFGQENSVITLFKIVNNTEAIRTSVKLGRRSVNFVEILEGLREGDRVILGDMQQYDDHNRLRIN